ncbi:uncharacterized protein LOC113550104 [Rhopalosiphum maidis]|uniref:uncharacterized protein LOC113550104 n=1 Tax=Rhopalosiphum maidis TaxID=43146 RepID=UPI000EFE0A3E|nr:uncharacterized protein LOC113550104 [Rhopalosiphum maidis]
MIYFQSKIMNLYKNLNSSSKKKKNENNFKTIIVHKLSLLVTNKSVGDSVKRLLSTMFDDKVLESYSTYVLKKRLIFSSLYTHQLLFGVLRTNFFFTIFVIRWID